MCNIFRVLDNNENFLFFSYIYNDIWNNYFYVELNSISIYLYSRTKSYISEIFMYQKYKESVCFLSSIHYTNEALLGSN